MNLSKWIAAIGIVIFVLPLSIQAGEKKVTPDSLAGITIVDTVTVKQWLDNGDDFFVLDARKKPDYEAGHLPDAELCTVPSDLDVSGEAVAKSVQVLKKYEALQELEKDTKIVAYCNNYT